MDNQQKYIAGGAVGIVALIAMLLVSQGTAPSTTGADGLPSGPQSPMGVSGGSYSTGAGSPIKIQIINQTKTANGIEILLQVPNPAGAPIAVNVYPAVNNTNFDEHVWVSVYGIQQEITYFDTPRAYYITQTPLAPAGSFANIPASTLPISTIEGNHTLIVTDTMTFTPQSTGSQNILITYEASEMPLELFVFVNGQNVTLIP